MNTELFIAKRLILDKENRRNISGRIVNIAIFGIAMGLIVMIVSVAIVTGFKQQIRNKVIGFGSHIQIINYDSNSSYETEPIGKKQPFYPSMNNMKGIKHIQVFATKAGIIKTATEIQGVVLKGVGSDFDWSFFKQNLVAGNTFKVNDSTKTNKVLISKYLASLLKLKVGEEFAMYFIQEPPRMRKFVIEGIYETSLEEFDKIIILADISHIQKLNNWNSDQVSGFEILINDFDQIDEMKHNIYKEAGNVFTKDGSKLKIVSIRDKYPQIFDWLNLQDMNVWIILILMLAVAGFNMVSGLLILILDRTNMIGILKALGAENYSIRRIFLYQSAFLIARGLLWGNIIAIGICLLQKYTGMVHLNQATYYISTVPINLKLTHVLLLNVGTLLVTFVLMLLPSLIIARISPVKTIQFD
jgi:lipoprotein-releasing system permease protein